MEKNVVMKRTGSQLRVLLRSSAVRAGITYVLEAITAAFFARGVMLGVYAPLGVAWAAATAAVMPESGRRKVYASLMGVVLGYCIAARVDGLRYAAAAVLASAVVMVFREVKHALFLPGAVVISMLAAGAVYVFTGAPTVQKVLLFLCEAALASTAAYFYAVCRRHLGDLRGGRVGQLPQGGKLGQWELYREAPAAAPAMVRAAFAAAAASAAACLGLAAPLAGIRLGCLASLVAVLTCTQAGAAFAGAAGLLLGAALDLCAGEILPPGYFDAGLAAGGTAFAAVYGFLGLFAGMYRKKGPFAVSIAFVLGNAAALPWLWQGTAAPLFEGFAASVVYLVFSAPLSRAAARIFPHRGVSIGPSCGEGGREAPPGDPGMGARDREDCGESVLEDRLDALRTAFAALRAAVIPPEYPSQSASENPGAVFTFAAERCCRSCSMRDVCWNREYSGTRAAFNDASPAMLRRGAALVTDFPPYFAARCLRLPELVACINDTLAAMRYQQRFRRRVREDNRLLCAQYDGMLTVLDELIAAGSRGASGEEVCGRERLRAIVGTAIRCRDGEEVCGDVGRYFRTRDGRLFLLISDGMGSGAGAGEQSAALAHMLESFLVAGVEPATALRLVCPAFALRSGGDVVVSIDLFELDLCTGEGVFYKCGAASSWLLRTGAAPRRIGGGSLPAGVTLSELAEAERIRLQLQPGDRMVMVSDGVEPAFIQEMPGKSPGELAAAILEEAAAVGGGDDMTVMVCGMSEK